MHGEFMKTLTNFELQVRCGKLRLPQLDHLEKCIKDTGTDSVSLIEAFDLWQCYETTKYGKMTLYAQKDWKHVSELINIVERQDSDWVYMAVNKYLLLCDPVENSSQDWDQALKDYFDQNLKVYKVVDYQFQILNYTGTVANFVSPDNRFLCKRAK